jgi:hypothetical protein
MNTPKTRQSRRYQVNPNIPSRPDGVWRAGICNDKYIPCIARLLTYWPIVEDAMIGVLSDLLGTKTGGQGEPARQIFRAVASNQARRKIMLSLLERTQLNRNKDSYYDEILGEFDKLNGKRNDYSHGLWYTHESGAVYLSEESIDDHHWLEARPVKIEEIEDVLTRMENLWAKITVRHNRSMLPELLSPRGKHPAAP